MKVLQILVLVFGIVIVGNAQNVTLNGKVLDLSNQPIPKFTVTIFGMNNEKAEIITGLDGIYSAQLKQGTYTFEFYAEGFIRTRIENYKVGDNGDLRLDATLYITRDDIGCLLPDNPVKKKKTKNKIIKRKKIINK